MINSPKSKFSKAQKYMDKATQYTQENNLDKAIDKLTQAKKIFNELRTPLMVASAEIKEGIIYEIQANWERALDHYFTALEIRKEFGTVVKIADTHRFISRVFYYLNDLDESQRHAQLAYDLIEDEEQDHPILQAEALFLLGSIYLKRREQASAIFYFVQARNRVSTNIDVTLYLKISQNLAAAYQGNGKYTQSNKIYFEILKIAQNLKIYPLIINILDNLAINLFYLGEIKKSYAYSSDSEEIYQTSKKQDPKMNNWEHLMKRSEVLLLLGKNDLADEFCEQAIIIAEEENNKNLLKESLMLMAKVLIGSYNGERNKFQLITNYLNESKDIAIHENDYDSVAETYLIKVQLYKNTPEEYKIPSILDEANNYAEENNLQLMKGKINAQYGIYYHLERDYDLASEYFQTSIEHFQEIGHIDYLAEAHYNYSCSACLLHMGEETLIHLKKAIELNPKYKTIAQDDSDFKSIYSEPAFQDIIE